MNPTDFPDLGDVEAPPVLLTKADALNFAAEKLEHMAASLKVAGSLLDVIEGLAGGVSEDDRAKIIKLRKAVPEPGVQHCAIVGAAKAIRDLALEERLLSARAGASF